MVMAIFDPAKLTNVLRSFKGRQCGIWQNMNSQDILDRLYENESALRARGVTHVALFGSRARGDNRPDSDIDIMIEIAPEVVRDMYDYVRLKKFHCRALSESCGRSRSQRTQALCAAPRTR